MMERKNSRIMRWRKAVNKVLKNLDDHNLGEKGPVHYSDDSNEGVSSSGGEGSQATSSTGGGSSPVTKRKGFNSRKWLPVPLRKRSQGRVEQVTSPTSGGPDQGKHPVQEPRAYRGQQGCVLQGSQAHPSKQFRKAYSEHKFKLGGGTPDMGNKTSSHSQSEEEIDVQTQAAAARVPPLTPAVCSQQENGEDDDIRVELPPPMKVLDPQQLQTTASAVPNATPPQLNAVPPLHGAHIPAGITNDGGPQPNRSSSLSMKNPDGTDLADEIEDIIKKKMEQHETKNYDHLSGWREPSQVFPNDEVENIVGAPAPGGCISNQADTREEIRPSSTLDDHNASAPVEKGNDDESSPVDSDMTYEARELQKRKFVLAELVETESFYVQDLEDLVQGYMAEMRNPDSEIKIPEELKDGKDKIVFCNIQAIYEWHRDHFSKNIKRCLENPAELGTVFQRSEKRLQIYVKYCQNKPLSENIVSEYFTYFEDLRQKLGHKLQIQDLLIKPVQRLMKYQLLLRDIHKHTERAGLHQEAECIKRALNIMIVVPKAADDMMNVGRLQGFGGTIMAQGKLLLYGSLLCSEGESAHNFRGKDLMVFLFEQSIIISETGKRKNQFSNPIYQFKQYFQVNKMDLEERVDDGDPLKFVIKSKDPFKAQVAYVCQGTDEDNRNQWTSQIRHLLHIQKDFLIAIQNPMAYQKEQTKNVSEAAHSSNSSSSSGSMWNPSLRKTFSQPSSHHHKHRHNNKANTIDIPTSRAFSHSSPTSPTEDSPRGPPPPPAPPVPPNYLKLQQNPQQSFPRDTSLDKLEMPSSPPKMKKTFFDGFRNTLRGPRVKVDGLHRGGQESSSADGAPESGLLSPSRGDHSEEFSRRWSESGSPTKQPGESSSVALPPGTLVKVLSNFTALREDEITVTRGEVIQVISSNASRGYLVHRAATSHSPAAEGWVASHVLLPSSRPSESTPPPSPTYPMPPNPDSPGKKQPWIKFRKPSFSKRGEPMLRREETLHEIPSASLPPRPRPPPPTRQMTVALINPYHCESSNAYTNKSFSMPSPTNKSPSGCVPASPESPIRIISPLHNVTVYPGEPAEMVCQISGAGLWVEECSVSWLGPHGELTDPRIEMEQHRDGTLRLHVGSCRVTDAGEYTCTITCAGHTVACSARINLAPGKPDHSYANGHS